MIWIDLFRFSEHKLRWDGDVDRARFELHNTNWRLSGSTDPVISVQTGDASLLDPSEQLSPPQKLRLANGGLPDHQVLDLDSWLLIPSNEEERSREPIIAAFDFDCTQLQTIRYTRIGHPDPREIGQPCPLISVLLLDSRRRSPPPHLGVLLVTAHGPHWCRWSGSGSPRQSASLYQLRVECPLVTGVQCQGPLPWLEPCLLHLHHDLTFLGSHRSGRVADELSVDFDFRSARLGRDR